MLHPTPDTSSSTRRENSAGFEEMLQLGQALVEQFERFEEDICGAWMAHHLARLIVEARQAPPSERDLAEERCRHAILEIWRYRRPLNSPRPLASADQTLEAIRALQHQEGPWYFNYISQEEIGRAHV